MGHFGNGGIYIEQGYPLSVIPSQFVGPVLVLYGFMRLMIVVVPSG